MDTATQPGGMSKLRKAPEQIQLLVVLIVDRLWLRTNEGGIEPKHEANFRTAAMQPKQV